MSEITPRGLSLTALVTPTDLGPDLLKFKAVKIPAGFFPAGYEFAECLTLENLADIIMQQLIYEKWLLQPYPSIDSGGGTGPVESPQAIPFEAVVINPYPEDPVFSYSLAIDHYENEDPTFIVDWGDGSPLESIQSGWQLSHDYPNSQTEWTVKITQESGFPIQMAWIPYVKSVVSWGTWNVKRYIFEEGTIISVPSNLSPKITSLEDTFRDCILFNDPNVSNWDTSNITNMSWTFVSARAFNQPLNSWNTSSVTSMSSMFAGANSFNRPIGNWNTSNVTNMSSMFVGASAFNQNLNSWNTSSVRNMDSMFQECYIFNQPLGNWDVSSVTNMKEMFYEARAFNQNLNNWNVSNVTTMSWMFRRTLAFNQPLNSWNTSNVTNMESMFQENPVFNQPLGNWDVSKVSIAWMTHMFHDATAFNQDLSTWCVTNITQQPYEFSLNSPLTAANKPVWGTCPAP